ncbi:FAD/NAD(P)-binding protein [Desulfurivibrio dismutans]|uniref:FAD/NAD(P)-binding protein n=1 Tax=Desulfurivibrio dismutans TaxID=1398908 RepID=UPI0023DA5025|nr:FAD/NAD(P)-binding protein [Desulfurivibrio alkaliphilus]MDF1613942.1 FAD/NAD(P)-binding protein [Desulfurivibrio alkaliphilus]
MTIDKIRPGGVIDPYLPVRARISRIIEENPRIRTLVLEPLEELPAANGARSTAGRSSAYQPGQFVMVSVPHCGEAPISLASSPHEPELRLSVLKVGLLTEALHRLPVGAEVGLRGPYGRPFPLADLHGRRLLFIAGGIGLAPLRSVLESCLAEPEKFGPLTLLYGSRTPADLAFGEDLARWQQSGRVDCRLTVDQGAPGWTGAVGLVTELLAELEPAPEQTSVLICGPPPMIRAVCRQTAATGIAPEQIITTLERQMKCGLGLCRHCHLDHHLVCVDGPVYTLAQLQQLEIMELG